MVAKKLYACPIFKTQTPSLSVDCELHTHLPSKYIWFNFCEQSRQAYPLSLYW